MSTESESNSSALNLEKSSLILVDVAGTTTSINFVKETLFPFVTTNVEKFLKSKWDEEQIKECIKLIKEDKDLDLETAIEKIKKLTEEKSDNKALKTIQGLIYKDGYEKGELKAHIFDDVPEAFESWASNRRIAIFSTGSLESQKLLFANTIHGDLSNHIHKYFDQDSGLKTEAETYKKIAKDVEVAPEEIVFITDDAKEATAAKSGGCTAVLIKRDGNDELPEEAVKEFTVISSFKELRLDKAAKRKIEEEPVAEEVPPTKVPKTEESEEKPEKEEKPTEIESMEVDTPVEKEKESKETEKPTETEPTPKETEKTETESEKTEPETKKEETTEEIKPEEKMETTDEVKSETKIEEPEKNEETKIEETKQEETTTAEKIDEKNEETKVVEETKPEEEKKVVEETKPEEEKKDDETQNGDEKPAENGDEKPESSTKTEEKENKSVLANGVENGKAEVSNNGAEASEVQIDEEKTEETEVCVKKLEESAESKTVSVEV